MTLRLRLTQQIGRVVIVSLWIEKPGTKIIESSNHRKNYESKTFRSLTKKKKLLVKMASVIAASPIIYFFETLVAHTTVLQGLNTRNWRNRANYRKDFCLCSVASIKISKNSNVMKLFHVADIHEFPAIKSAINDE